MKVARNDPCHCGSGKKYKVCHLRQDQLATGGGDAAGEAPGVPGAPRRPLGPWPYAIAGAGVVIAIVVGVMSTVGNALTVAAAWALAFAAYMVFRDPPPPREDAGNPAALDFGMSSEQRKRQKK